MDNSVPILLVAKGIERFTSVWRYMPASDFEESTDPGLDTDGVSKLYNRPDNRSFAVACDKVYFRQRRS